MSLRDAACAYADRGWCVLPLRPGGKAPLGALVPHGKDDATSDLATVFGWWAAEPRANVGIACGPSGLVVIDVDPRNGGDDSLAEMWHTVGPLPPTIEAFTGGGGQHHLFRHPGVPLLGQLAPGIDIKDSGYIVAPPSIHPSGRRYEWSVDGHPDDVVLATVPSAWLERMTTFARRREAPPRNERHDDPLRGLPADVYFPRLTGRPIGAEGFARCPFHKAGEERTPSLKVDGTLWACFGCQPPPGKVVMGGNIYEFAGLLWGYPVPLRGSDFIEAKTRLRREFL